MIARIRALARFRLGPCQNDVDRIILWPADYKDAAAASLKAHRALSSVCRLPALLFAAYVVLQPFSVEAENVDRGSVPTISVAATSAASNALTGPEAVPNRLEQDRANKDDRLDEDLLDELKEFKGQIYEKTGLSFGADYNVLYFGATDGLGDDTTVTGVGRLFGSWEILGRGTNDTGSLVFKIEYRDAFTDYAATDFNGQLGYVGLNSSVFSDQGFRTTNLYWRQSFLQEKAVGYVGFIDVTDFVDVYALASPWTSFSNIAFATGSGSIGGLPDGALGAMFGGFITDNFYAVAGIADANADPTDVFDGFQTFSDEFETFKSVEAGWTSGPDRLFVDNIHVTLWQLDERRSANAPGGWGVSGSVTGAIGETWLPFLRGGWAHDGSSLYEASVSAGFGYQSTPGGDVLGAGVNWGRPNADTFGAALDDQFTSEMFYRLQLTENVQITPSVQLLWDPALNEDDDFIALFGLRGRISF